ncbi:MAG: DUF309 domain-containing protein [Clostridia bacterium]|nr:DUF309 domain-containing protein [Clostridia bacterium]MCL6521204.1 DUF309 domain-containing protein [Bacillota bacterium]
MKGWPEAYVRFVELFNQGRYFESHEVLEKLWLRAGRDRFYQALIILAAAHVHAGRGNLRGFRRHLEQAAAMLEGYPPRFRGLDVDGLRGWIRRTLERFGAAPEALPEAAAAPPTLELSPPGSAAEVQEGESP